MSIPAEEVERAKATAERAARELCQAQGRAQPIFEWVPATDTPERLTISIEGLDPIEVEVSVPSLTAHGGIGAARVARMAIMNALRSR